MALGDKRDRRERRPDSIASFPLDRTALRALTRIKLGDRAVGTGNTLWDNTDLDVALDVAYGEIWTDLIDKKSPIVTTISYLKTRSAITLSTLPGIYAGEVKWANVSDNGTNLATSTLSSDRTELILTDMTEGVLDWKRGRIGSVPYYFTIVEGDQAAVLPAVDTGGRNALEISHTYWPTWRANTVSEPDLPVQFRPLIAYKAAVELRGGYDMPTGDIRPDIAKLEKRMYGMAKEVVADTGRGFSVSGYPDTRQFAIRTGFRRKIRNFRSRLVRQ